MGIYIFLTHSIANIGGAEIYLRNKSNYLKKEGWKTYIFSCTKGDIIISDLKEYEKYIIPDLFIPPILFNKSTINNLVGKILGNIESNDNVHNIIIESCNLYVALWGELIAEKLNAKHLIFSLQENDKIASEGLFDFLSFKFHRKELAGITPKSLQYLFKPFFNIPPEQSYYLHAFCNNPVEDIDLTQLNHDKFHADYIIGNLGRLNKPYLNIAINDILDFTSKHKNLNFIVYLIGGCNKKNRIEKKIKKKFDKSPNVRLIITGYIYPIPLSLIMKLDVALCSAGSVIVTSNLGIPTISYSSHDLQPLGVFGYTTHNSLYRDKEPIIGGSNLLNDILIKKMYTKNKCNFKPIEYDFSSHLDFINKSTTDKKYFQINKYSYNFIEKLCALILHIGDFKTFKGDIILRKIVRRFITHI